MNTLTAKFNFDDDSNGNDIDNPMYDRLLVYDGLA
jgi:hypothetical protein